MNFFSLLIASLLLTPLPLELPLPVSGEVDARLRAAGEGPLFNFLPRQMCGAPDICATQGPSP